MQASSLSLSCLPCCDLCPKLDILATSLGLPMATASYGTLIAFCPDLGKFFAYLEKVELYFIVNKISDDKKVQIFLHVIGGSVYGMVH